MQEESITGVDASCFRPGWSESVSFPDSDGDDVHQCKKQKVGPLLLGQHAPEACLPFFLYQFFA